MNPQHLVSIGEMLQGIVVREKAKFAKRTPSSIRGIRPADHDYSLKFAVRTDMTRRWIRIYADHLEVHGLTVTELQPFAESAISRAEYIVQCDDGRNHNWVVIRFRINKAGEDINITIAVSEPF